MQNLILLLLTDFILLICFDYKIRFRLQYPISIGFITKLDNFIFSKSNLELLF